RSARRRAGAAVVAADLNGVGAGFGDAARDDADPCGRDELDVDPRSGIEGAQIENQLRKVLDAVDVVMHRRRNQRRPRLRMTQLRDVRYDFERWQLAA